MTAENIGEKLALRAAEVALQAEAEHPANLDMAIQQLACKIARLELDIDFMAQELQRKEIGHGEQLPEPNGETL